VKEEVIHAHISTIKLVGAESERYLLLEACLYKRRIRVCRDIEHSSAYLSLGYVLSYDRVAQSNGQHVSIKQ
jgi:hypothetical protein